MPGNDELPVTPDGRYFVVRGRLWRMTDPSLDPDLKSHFVTELMVARRAVGVALRERNKVGENEARVRVAAAKRALGERGSVCWDDNAPDYNRHMVKNTPYSTWFDALVPRHTDADD